MPELIKRTKEDLGEATEVKESDIRQFRMVKNCVGAFSITLEPHDYSGTPRRIRFKFDNDYQYVPTKYALGVFTSDENTRLLERGYFTFVDLDKLIKMAEGLGYLVPDSIKEPKMSLKELKSLLRKGDTKEMEKALLNANKKIIDDFILLAKKMYNNLNISVVRFIEDKYKISLAPINLDA